MLTDQISLFDDLASEPRTIHIDQWIEYCTTGWMFERHIHEYRFTGDKSFKLSLPLVTVGAVCFGGRKRSNVIQKTGLIAIDIDYKDNTHIESAEALRDEIAKISFVIYSGLSVSGKGVWALLRVSDSDRLKDHFKQLTVDFESLNIRLDPTKGQNPNDARFLSFDPKGILKSEYKIYDRLPIERLDFSKPKHHIRTNLSVDIFDNTIRQIENRQLDIAPDYHTYLNIGFAIADEYGELGRDIFHAVVCYSPKYNRREADLQYTRCLKSNGRGITIGSLYYYFKINGLSYPGMNSLQSVFGN